ncbi:hypothetical protein F5051DRAFT_431998 [Lentinula edodes]|nr:hypothetical protein F5051DRAFT_431998 [Lentinula edodes]
MRRDPSIYLPGDVFTEIFEIVRDSPTYGWPQQVLVLASVCRGWREVAVGTPTLWRYIVAPAYDIRFIALSLERSQQCPLVIEYHTKRPDHSVLYLLAKHSERWEHLSLCIPPSSYPLLSTIKGKVPLLKRLALQATTEDDPQPHQQLSGFEIAPALQYLNLRWFYPDLRQDSSTPWVRLTYLCCQSIELSRLHSLLANTPTLSTLHVSDVSHDWPYEQSKNEVLTQLKVLSIVDCDLWVIYSLLSRFSNLAELSILIFSDPGQANTGMTVILPHLYRLKIQINGIFPGLVNFLVFEALKLSELEFSGCHSLEDSDDEHEDRVEESAATGRSLLQFLWNFIQSSRCSLTSLVLHFEVDFPACEMAPLLKALLSLEHLDISVVHMECVPFCAMLPATTVFPKLQTLYLHIPSEAHSIEVVNDLIALATSSHILKVQLVDR